MEKNIHNSAIIGGFGTDNPRNTMFNKIEEDIKNGKNIFIADTNKVYTTQFADLLVESGYNVIYYDLTELTNSHTFNPISYALTKKDDNEQTRLINEFVSSIIKTNSNSSDPFWENSASDLVSGCIMAITSNEGDNNNIVSADNLLRLAATDFEMFKSVISDSSELVKSLTECFVNAPIDTRGGIYSVASQKLRLFTSRDNLSKFVSNSSFEFEEIKNKKTAILFNGFDVVTLYNSIIKTYIEQLYDFASCEKIDFSFYIENIELYKSINYFVNIIRTNNEHINFSISALDKEALSNVYGKQIIDTFNIIDGEKDVLLGDKLNTISLFKFPGNKLK